MYFCGVHKVTCLILHLEQETFEKTEIISKETGFPPDLNENETLMKEFWDN